MAVDQSTLKRLTLPVFLPGDRGEITSFVIGEATVYKDMLVIKFDGSTPSEALRRVLSREEVVGATFVINPKNDEEN